MGRTFRLMAISIVATGLCAFAACSVDSETPAPTQQNTPSPSGAAVTSPPIQEETTLDEAYIREAQKKVSVVEKRLRTKSSLYDKLNTIVTEYCIIKLLVNPTPVDTSEAEGLIPLYAKYWEATPGGWNSRLDEAARQEGACPSAFPTSSG